MNPIRDSISENRMSRFLTYLERSKNALLRVRFEILDFASGHSAGRQVYRVDHDKAWRVLCEHHAHRCRSLHVETAWSSHIKDFSLPLPNRFDHLETLDISVFQRAPPEQHLFDGSCHAPLKELRLRYPLIVPHTFLLNALPDFLERLTIVVGLKSIPAVMEFLTICPRLFDLNIEFPLEVAIPKESAPLITLSSLRILRVSHLWPSELQRMIRAPNVTSLSYQPKLVDDSPPPEVWKESYEGAIQQVGSGKLQELEILGHIQAEYEPPLSYIRLVLQRNPCIQFLRFSSWEHAWHIIWYLHPDPTLVLDRTLMSITPSETEVEALTNAELEQTNDAETLIHPPLVPKLEHLELDACSWRMVYHWSKAHPLMRAVLRSRPRLRVVEDSAFLGLPTQLKEFGGRFKERPDRDFPVFGERAKVSPQSTPANRGPDGLGQLSVAS